MPRPCSVCASENRPAIDAALVAGTSLRTVATAYALSAAAVHRHRRHASAELAPRAAGVHASRERTLASLLADVLDRSEGYERELARLAREAEETDNPDKLARLRTSGALLAGALKALEPQVRVAELAERAQAAQHQRDASSRSAAVATDAELAAAGLRRVAAPWEGDPP